MIVLNKYILIHWWQLINTYNANVDILDKINDYEKITEREEKLKIDKEIIDLFKTRLHKGFDHEVPGVIVSLGEQVIHKQRYNLKEQNKKIDEVLRALEAKVETNSDMPELEYDNGTLTRKQRGGRKSKTRKSRKSKTRKSRTRKSRTRK